MPSTRSRKATNSPIHGIGAGVGQRLQESSSVVIQAPQVLEQSQSIELMKIVSTAVISQIAHARNLFPACRLDYEHRVFNPADPDPSYVSFIKRETGTRFSESTHGLCFWKLLPRGTFSACDKLLDWLENGVADALKRGYLERLQFTIHDHGEVVSEANLRESYTLTFKYGDEIGMELVSARGIKNSQLVSTAKDQLYKLVCCVQMELSVDNSNHFEALPRHCQVNMNLVYNESCPEGYHAPGFKAASEDVSNILRTTSIDQRLTMNTAFHSVGIGWSIPLAASNPIPLDPEQKLSAFRDTCSDKAHVGSSQHAEPHPSKNSLLSAQDEALTQVEMMGPFKSMGPYRELHGTSTETQIMSQPLGKELSVSTATSQSINDGTIENRPEPGQFLRCLCNLDLTDLNLIRCKSCGLYQHVSCCGFLDAWPSDHTCYECVLNSCSQQTNRQESMNELCLKRLLLHFLRDRNSGATIEDFRKRFGTLNIDKTLKILTREKYIQHQGPSKRRVKGQRKQKPTGIKLVASDQRLLADYFNPKKWIEDLLENKGTRAPKNDLLYGNDSASLPYPPSTLNCQDTLHNTTSGYAGDTITNSLLIQPPVSDGSTTVGEPSPPISQSSEVRRQSPRKAMESPKTPSMNIRKRKAAAFAAPLENSLTKRQSWNASQARTPPNFDRDVV